MCDTLYKKTESGAVFLKNSDRSANEPNLIVFVPERKAGKQLKCTYITLPDADAFSMILYKPSWIWGAEMGINEKGVSIGNEAVWTKSGGKKTERLLGMDLLRLGLERGATAKQALEVIINLLEEFGQGGNAGFDHAFYYDNSFLIADLTEAYVLETAGKSWAWKHVEKQANISNRLSIALDYDKSSTSGNFKKTNIEPVFSFFSGSAKRKLSGECALSNLNDFDLASAFSALRRHKEALTDASLFKKGSVDSVCMHAGGVGDQTTGSMAVFYINGKTYVWVTGSATPCLSMFKPVIFGAQAPVFSSDKDSYKFWLEREYVNRAIYAGLIDSKAHRSQIAEIEKGFTERFYQYASSAKRADMQFVAFDVSEQYKQFCADCLNVEKRFYAQYADAVTKLKTGQGRLPRYWAEKTEKLGGNVFDAELCKRI